MNIREYFGFREWTFALFLLAGIFKPNPETSDLPVDLTVLTAVLCFIFVAWRYLQLKDRLIKPLILIAILFLLFVPTLLWTDWNSYAVDKAARFFTLTLLAAVAPIYIVRTSEDLRRFLSGFVFLCSVVTAAAFVVMLSQGEELDRLVALDATTIVTARAIGIVILTLGLLWFEVRHKRWLIGSALVVLPTLLVSTGAKGPLLATPVALIVSLIAFGHKIRSQITRVLLMAFLGVTVFWLSIPLIPWTSLLRVGTFVVGSFGSSEIDRTSFYADALSGIRDNPQGLGLGGFASKFGVSGGEIREFPHNTILEAFLEGGWLAGAYFVFLLWLALKASLTLGREGTTVRLYRLLFCFNVFLLLNDLVSGELNDSKASLAFMGMSIGLYAYSHQTRLREQRWVEAPGSDRLLTQKGSD